MVTELWFTVFNFTKTHGKGQKLTKNAYFPLGYACCSVKTSDFMNLIENHIYLEFL